MTRLFLAGALALALTTGVAVAQTTTSQTTTTVTPDMPIAPPVGTLSTTRTRRTTDEDGTRTDSNRTTYRSGEGVRDDSETRTTTYPSPADTTTRSSTTTITR